MREIDIDLDDLTQPLEGVVSAERAYTCPIPLKIEDRRRLFARWCELNPDALDQIELAAIVIDVRGMRVSAKYLIERQRYEGTCKLCGVPFFDDHGVRREYCINNTDTPLLSRWLLERHPDMNIELRKSAYDTKEDAREA